ncbi:MAG: AAA family ATPase [Thermoplasmata archaeon]|nr:AAA family ATPase [Thermoplasmata archaeon]MCI4361765.1 AAA family ATPase [Thermoplasmata archaeon]
MPARGDGRVVALEGPSAVGKTTVSRLLADRADWTVIGEAAVRLDPPPSLRVVAPADLLRIERRLLREERRRCRTAERLRRKGVDVLLDTGPVGAATYALGMAAGDGRYASAARAIVTEVVRDLETGRLTVPDRVLYLTASDATLRSRANLSRAEHPAELAPRHWQVGRFERAFWEGIAERSGGSVALLPSRGSPSTGAERLRTALARPAPRLARRLLVARLREAARRRPSAGTEIVKNRARSRRPPRR